jgi:hypothetical protein
MAKLKGGTRVYGSAIIDAALTAQDVTILGNLNIKGTTTTIDTAVSTVKDPVITLGADANGVAVQDGLDRGLVLRYNDGTAKDGFMGWDQTNGEFALAATTTFDSANNSVAITSYGNVHAAHFVGEGDTLGNITGANVTGTVRNANMSAFAQTVTGAAQSNITSVGTLTSVTVGNATSKTVMSDGTVTFTTTGTANIGGDINIGGNANIGNLFVDGTIHGNFSGSTSAPGATTQVVYNDAGTSNASAGFTFSKTSNALNVTGTITGGNLVTAGDASVTGVATIGTLAVTADASVTGVATIANLVAGVASVTGVATVGSLTTASTVTATGNVIGGNLTTAGDVTTATVTASGSVTAGSLSTAGDATVTGLVTGGNFTTGGNITGSGSSSTLTIKTVVATGTADVTGVATVGSLTTAGTVDATGTITGGDLTTAGRVSTTNLTITGSVTGDLVPAGHQVQDLGSETKAWRDLWLSGNSIKLGTQSISSSTTGVSVSNALSVTDLVASNSVSAVTMTASGSITGADVTANNLTTTQVVFADGKKLTSAAGFTYANATLTTQNVAVTADATVGGTLNVTGATTLAGLTAGTTVVGGLTAGASTLASASVTDTLNVAGATTLAGLTAGATSVGTLAAGVTTITGTASVSDTATVGSLVTAGTVTATGSVTAGSLSTAGDATVSGTVNTPNVSSATSLTVSSLSGGITLSASTGVIDASAGRLTNLGAPTQASDAATKAYVDSTAQGLDVKQSVRAATTSNVTLTGTQTVDGVAVANGDRILVKSQTTASENGIYVVGTPWTRSIDAVAGDISGGTFTFVEEGTLNADSGWVVSTNGTIDVGTTPITWTQFSGAGQLSAAHGIALTGGQFSTVTDDSTIEVGLGNALRVKDGLTLVTPNIGAATGASLNLGTGLVTGNGSTLFDINGANVSEVALATTVTAAAQTAITTVGTLTNLAVAGEVNIGVDAVIANSVGIFTDGYYYANGAAIDFQTAAGSEYQIQFHKSGANDLDASANLTFNGTALGVTGTATVSGQVTAGSIVDSSLTATRVTFAGTDGLLTDSADLKFVAGTLTTVTANVTTLNAATITDSSLTQGQITFAGINGTLTDDAKLAFDGSTLVVGADATVSGQVTAGSIVDSSLTATRVTFAGTDGLLTDAAGLVYDSLTAELAVANVNVAGYSTAANVTARNLTSGRVVLAGSAGLLSDSDVLTFNTGTLTTTNVTATAAITAATFSGDGSALSAITGANVTGQVANALVAGTVYTAAQPAITSVGTLTSLAVSGISDLNSVGSVKISGGTDGQYLKSTGSGGLTFASLDLTKIENGTSSVSIPTADGDIRISQGGALVLNISGTGANVTGVLNVSGDVNANNITAASSIKVTDGAAATSTITGAVTVAGGIAATGNIYAGKAVGFADNNGGTDSKAYIQFNSTANSLDFIFN